MDNVRLYLLTIFLVILPNLSLLDARKFEISNGVFSVDLVHRHSIHSPYYNSTMTRKDRSKRSPLGSISHGHKIHLSHSHHRQKDAKSLGLVLEPDGGEYMVRFTLGTPPVEQFAIADTGSSLTWVQCAPCVFCIPQKSPLFNPTTSSTFQTIPCSSKACTNYLDFTPISCPLDTKYSTNSLPCLYFNSYGDDTNSIGVLATETIGFPSIDDTYQTLPSSIFGCGFDQNATEHKPILAEGIIGLGAGPSSLISQLGSLVNYKFSYCLAPLTSGVTSKLNFGVDVKGPRVLTTPFKANMTFYHLTLNGISIGNKHTRNKIDMSEGLDMIIDSGTTLTYLPQSVYEGVIGAMISAIKLSPVNDPIYGLCYKTHRPYTRRKFNPPDVVFHFEGADVVLKGYNTFREIDDGYNCLAMGGSESPFIFGNIAQVNYHVGYDLQAKQISFAPTDCANH